MTAQLSETERTGILAIVGGVKSEEKALVIKAALEDLPGVHEVDFVGPAARVRFEAEMVTAQQLYNAVKTVGFQASELHVA